MFARTPDLPPTRLTETASCDAIPIIFRDTSHECLNLSGVVNGVSAAEWQIRCDLAALYRLVAHHRWTDFIYTHLSARLPGPQHHFLINKYGVNFHEMRASDLVKIDVDGNVVEEERSLGGGNVNAAGFTIHSAIHMAREDLMCVVHTHTAAGIAVSAQKDGLLPLSQHACKFYGRLAYHGYEGIALDLNERDRLVADLGQHKAMILRNHGLLVGGTSIPEAFLYIYMLERACAAQIDALAGGGRSSCRRQRSALIRRSSFACRRMISIMRWSGTRPSGW